MQTLWPLPMVSRTPFPLAPDPWSPTGDPSVWTALRAWVKVQFPTVWDDSHLGLHYSGHKRWVWYTSTFFDHLLTHKLPHDPAFETFPLWVQDALRRYQQPRAHWTDYATSPYFPGSASVSVWLYAPEGWWICQRSARVATGRGQWTAPVLGGIDPQDWAVGGLAEYQAARRETLEEGRLLHRLAAAWLGDASGYGRNRQRLVGLRPACAESSGARCLGVVAVPLCS